MLLLIILIILVPSSYQLPAIALPMGSFYITLVEMVIFVIVFLWFMRVLFSQETRRKGFLFSKYVISVLCLYAVYVIVGVFQRDAIMVLGDFRQYMPLVLYFPLLYELRTQENPEKFRHALLVSLIVIALYIIITFSFFGGYLMTYAAKHNIGFTAERIFIDNSVFLYFAYLGYIIAALVVGPLCRKRRLLYFAIVLLGVVVLLIMQVRNFWMITMGIFMLSFFSLETASHKLKYASTAVIATLFITTVIVLMLQVTDYKSKTIDSIKDRFGSFSELDKVGQHKAKRSESLGSLDTRLKTAEVVIEKFIAANWMFGLGFGGQIPMVNYLGAATLKYQIDNGYLTLLAKFGAFGMLFYALFTFKIMISLFRIIFNPLATKEDLWMAKSFLYAMVGMAAGSFFTSIFIREQACIVSFVIMLCEIEFIHQRLMDCKALNGEKCIGKKGW